MLAGSSREDDTCLLICQLTPERARVSGEPLPEPEPESLPEPERLP
jgi:hypothetical protein